MKNYREPPFRKKIGSFAAGKAGANYMDSWTRHGESDIIERLRFKGGHGGNDVVS